MTVEQKLLQLAMQILVKFYVINVELFNKLEHFKSVRVIYEKSTRNFGVKAHIEARNFFKRPMCFDKQSLKRQMTLVLFSKEILQTIKIAFIKMLHN